MLMRRHDVEAELCQPLTQLHRQLDNIREALFDLQSFQSRLQRKEQVRRMSKRNSLLRRIKPQIKVAWQFVWTWNQIVVVEDHRQSRKRAQSFAAHARRQMHAIQIDGDRADRADAIQAKPP